MPVTQTGGGGVQPADVSDVTLALKDGGGGGGAPMEDGGGRRAEGGAGRSGLIE